MELAAGSPAGIDAKRQELLDTLSCVPMSARIAVKAGMLYRDLRGRGADIGPLDVIIAASAVVLNEPIVTHNAKHFSRVEGLRVITY